MYTSPGTYSVSLIVADSSGADTLVKSDYISVLEPLSVSEADKSKIKEDMLKIFPNPASSSLTVEFSWKNRF